MQFRRTNPCFKDKPGSGTSSQLDPCKVDGLVRLHIRHRKNPQKRLFKGLCKGSSAHRGFYQGVVVESDEPRRPVYYMDVATKYGQALHSATDALRPNQGREVSEQYRKDLKAVPVLKNIMSLDAFKGKVAIQTQKAAEKARAEMVSQNLQPQRVKEEEKEPESQAAASTGKASNFSQSSKFCSWLNLQRSRN